VNATARSVLQKRFPRPAARACIAAPLALAPRARDRDGLLAELVDADEVDVAQHLALKGVAVGAGAVVL
jgi:hypothetical protein